MSCVYVLKSVTGGSIYIGSSHEDDPTIRLQSHNSGRVRSTKFGRPWIVIHYERTDDYTLARKREIFLKTGVGRKWIKKNLFFRLKEDQPLADRVK
jgi:putative endonuclease